MQEGGLAVGARERDLYGEDGDDASADGDPMSIFHSNKYALENACDICDGIVTHRDWCIEVNDRVLEAWKATFDGLDQGDEARLAGLGVRWGR